MREDTQRLTAVILLAHFFPRALARNILDSDGALVGFTPLGIVNDVASSEAFLLSRCSSGDLSIVRGGFSASGTGAQNERRRSGDGSNASTPPREL